jgi:hypothetical protein
MIQRAVLTMLAAIGLLTAAAMAYFAGWCVAEALRGNWR